jgi:hypothetical protein
MLVETIIAVCAAISLAFFALAIRRLRRRRLMSCTIHSLSGLVFVLAGACAGLLGFDALTYHRLTYEQPALDLLFSQRGERDYDVLLSYPAGATRRFELRGDEWQVDARVLKWHGFADIIGFDTVYRLERISGRYRDIGSERAAARTVYALNDRETFDVWDLARRYKQWVPWVDTLYGSATYLPMADGARYEIKVSQTGLVARPLNQPAQQAIGGWR